MRKFLFLLFLCGNVFAGCPNLYPNNTPIVIDRTKELCNSFYVSLYSESKRAVILVSERFEIGQGDKVNRVNAFKADTRVANPVRPTEYVGSGWDKGHLAAADNADTEGQMYQTFFMTNMTPQNPVLNRGQWKALETKVRAMAKNQQLWVLNIPVYPNSPQFMGTVPIPSGYWKIVIVGNKQQFFFADNTATAQVKEYQTSLQKILANL